MFTSHITASEMFKYKWKCFIVRPPFLHWLLPSFLYNICLFPSFSFLLSHLFWSLSSSSFPDIFHLTTYWPIFFPKASPGSSKSSIPFFKTSVPTGLEDFQYPVISQDHPMWDFASHNLSTQWKWTSKATLKKKRKRRVITKGQLEAWRKDWDKDSVCPGSQLQVHWEVPICQILKLFLCGYSLCQDPILTHCTSYPLPLFQSWFGEE